MKPFYIQMVIAAVVVLITFGSAPRAADVAYVSGGAGVDEREALLTQEKDYSLKIVTAETSGDYLAGVQVVIESAKKQRLLETTMDGPILLAKLAPGTYTIRATSGEKTLTKTVTIAAQGLRLVDFRWR
jgi:hypothetical protein